MEPLIWLASFFNFIPAPGITSFAPTIGGTGTTIAITGSNFTGTTAVSIGGVAATSFTVVNATTITAVVGNAATGNIIITTPGGTATVSGFVFSIPTALPGVNINSSAIVLYPNPATEIIIIDHPMRPKTSTVRIIDMYGRIVKEIIIQ